MFIKREGTRKPVITRGGKKRTLSPANMNMLFIICVYICTGGAALLYILYKWVIPASLRQTLVLLWHDFLLERLLDKITGSTRPQRILRAVQKNATRGDPCSVVKAIDEYCTHKEWAMNVGDEKGWCVSSLSTFCQLLLHL